MAQRFTSKEWLIYLSLLLGFPVLMLFCFFLMVHSLGKMIWSGLR